jgi:hypothetical protein
VMDDGRVKAVCDALTSLSETARKCPHVTRLFVLDPPTMWDRRHADIDALLDRLDQLSTREPAAL